MYVTQFWVLNFIVFLCRGNWMIVLRSLRMMMEMRLMRSSLQVMCVSLKIPEAEVFEKSDQQSSVRKRRLYCRYVWNTCTKY